MEGGKGDQEDDDENAEAPMVDAQGGSAGGSGSIGDGDDLVGVLRLVLNELDDGVALAAHIFEGIVVAGSEEEEADDGERPKRPIGIAAGRGRWR